MGIYIGITAAQHITSLSVVWSNHWRLLLLPFTGNWFVESAGPLLLPQQALNVFSKSSDSLTFSMSLPLIWGLKFDIEDKVNTQPNWLLSSGSRHERSTMAHICGLHRSNGGRILQGFQFTTLLLRKKIPQQKLPSSTPHHSLYQKKLKEDVSKHPFLDQLPL